MEPPPRCSAARTQEVNEPPRARPAPIGTAGLEPRRESRSTPDTRVRRLLAMARARARERGTDPAVTGLLRWALEAARNGQDERVLMIALAEYGRALAKTDLAAARDGSLICHSNTPYFPRGSAVASTPIGYWKRRSSPRSTSSPARSSANQCCTRIAGDRPTGAIVTLKVCIDTGSSDWSNRNRTPGLGC